MTKKATVRAPSNIAFIKYWGAKDLEQAIPTNPSISMTLDACFSRTTVEHLAEDGEHEIRWRGRGGGLETAPPSFARRANAHLDLLRDRLACGGRFRVATENSFPAAAGIASSASGFAALALGVLAALGREVSLDERSNLARLSGSGSASRSVMGGYVEWPAGGNEMSYHADRLHAASHWALSDVVAIVETRAKKVASLDGHRRAPTSPYFERRLAELPRRLTGMRAALAEKNIEALGTILEEEAIDLHCVAMTSSPPIFYWQPGTLAVLEAVRDLRDDGLAAYSTMDAGANVHVICPPEDLDEIDRRLNALPAVTKTIRDGVGEGPIEEDEHLF